MYICIYVYMYIRTQCTICIICPVYVYVVRTVQYVQYVVYSKNCAYFASCTYSTYCSQTRSTRGSGVAACVCRSYSFEHIPPFWAFCRYPCGEILSCVQCQIEASWQDASCKHQNERWFHISSLGHALSLSRLGASGRLAQRHEHQRHLCFTQLAQATARM